MSNASETDVGTDDQPKSTPKRPEGRIVRKGEADAQAIIDAIQRAAHPKNDDLADRIKKKGDEQIYLTYHDLEDQQLPDLRWPGFGEPEDDCEEFILPAMRFCTSSGKTKQFKHNCMRYDCPAHAPYAIRRRAGGSKDAAGMLPQLKSLISWLYAYRDTNHHYHHLFVSLPTDRPWLFESENPLERGFEVCRDIMDELGIQGAVAYHGHRGPGDDEEGDARGWYKDVLFKKKDWDDVRPDLRREPHFHIVGVAPHVDVSVTEEVYEETGWIIKRRQDEKGRSIVGRDGDPNDSDDDAAARALTYVLSHAPVYTASDGSRRLAARMKGPDVAKVETYDGVKADMQQKVYQASEKVLGISPPDLECDCEECNDPEHDPADDVDDDADGSVNMATMTKPVSGPGGAAARAPWSSFGAAGGGHTDGVELHGPATKWDDFNRPAGSWSDRNVSSGSGPGAEDRKVSSGDVDGDDQEAGEKCGSYLKHISQAGEYLLDAEWRERAAFGEELEETYRNYVDYMTSRDLDPLEDGVPELPEERTTPPPD